MSKMILLFMILSMGIFVASSAATEGEAQDGTVRTRGSGYCLRAFAMGSAGGRGVGARYRLMSYFARPMSVLHGTGNERNLYAYCVGSVRIGNSNEDSDSPERTGNMLFQNFPNPFNPATTIEYAVVIESPVEMAIFDIQGRKVRTLVDEVKSPGRYNVVWDGTNDKGDTVSSGIYLYRLTVGTSSSVRKMLVIR